MTSIANPCSSPAEISFFQNMFVITDVFNVTRYNELAKTVQDKFYEDTPQVPSQEWTTNRPVFIMYMYCFSSNSDMSIGVDYS